MLILGVLDSKSVVGVFKVSAQNSQRAKIPNWWLVSRLLRRLTAGLHHTSPSANRSAADTVLLASFPDVLHIWTHLHFPVIISWTLDYTPPSILTPALLFIIIFPTFKKCLHPNPHAPLQDEVKIFQSGIPGPSHSGLSLPRQHHFPLFNRTVTLPSQTHLSAAMAHSHVPKSEVSTWIHRNFSRISAIRVKGKSDKKKL